MNRKVIGIWIDGNATWHIVGGAGGDYVTACCLDGNDSVVGQTGTIEAPRGQKIDCPQCRQLWQEIASLKLRRSDFA